MALSTRVHGTPEGGNWGGRPSRCFGDDIDPRGPAGVNIFGSLGATEYDILGRDIILSPWVHHLQTV